MYLTFPPSLRARFLGAALVLGGCAALAFVLFAVMVPQTAKAEVSVEALPVPDAKVPPGASLETVTAFEVTSTQTLNLYDITVHASGTLNAVTGVAAVYLALDENDDGYFRSGDDPIIGYDIFSDAGGTQVATLSFGERLLQPGVRKRFFVVVDLQPWATLDATFGADVVDVTHSPALPVPALPVSGGELYVTNNTAYMRLAGPLPTGTKSLSPGAYDVALTEMQGRAYGHAMALKSLTFVDDGDGDPSAGISQVEVWLDTDVSWDFDRDRDTLLGSGAFASGADSLTIELYDPNVNGPPWFLVDEPRWVFVRVHLSQNAPGGETYRLRVGEATVEFAPASGLPITASPLYVDAPPPDPGNGNGEDPGDPEDPGDDNENGDNGEGDGDDADAPPAESSRTATLLFCGSSHGGVTSTLALMLLLVLLLLAVGRRRRRSERVA